MSTYGSKLVRTKYQLAKHAAICIFGRPGLLAVLILVLGISGTGWAQSPQTVKLYWDANTETDLAGYVLVWGSTSGIYSGSFQLGKAEVSYEAPCPTGTIRFFAIRAFNSANQQSAYSKEIRVECRATVPTRLAPSSLGNVLVVVVRRG